MKTCPTYWAKIFVGTLCLKDKTSVLKARLHRRIQKYVDDVKLCVTVDDTVFRYVDGDEPGLVIGLINYPRYPSTSAEIRRKAMELAVILKKEARQERLSVMFPEETVMLEENE